ncbi:MAG: protelomerase family protein [Leptolyngbyaceae bacterium]|nr:protelomerase family protein [Leptolyngbyaceae bacterium]
MNLTPQLIGEMTNNPQDNLDNNPIVLSPQAVNAVVYRASNLLVRNNWADIACGIAILTGRLYDEVMKTMTFEWASNFSVYISSDAYQRPGAKTPSLEIPTLCRADRVIAAITKLRAMILTHTLTMKQVKSRYSEGIFLSCGRYFEDLIPSLSEQQKYHAHLFHRLYATIAYYFYCPSWVSKHDFQQYLQAYATLDDPKNQAISQKSGYTSDSYAINDRDVIVDEHRQVKHGTRLTQSDVQIIDIFQRSKDTDKSERRIVRTQISDTADHGSSVTSQNEVSLETTSTIDQEPNMAKENLSTFELITYSEAYQRAVERGFTGNKREFRGASTKEPDVIASKFGVQRDQTITNPAINQPTWRDLQGKDAVSKSATKSPTKNSSKSSTKSPTKSPAKSPTKSPAKSSTKSPAKSSAKDSNKNSTPTASKPEIVSTSSSSNKMAATQETELDFVRKLSTGIDFLSREVDSLRVEKENLKKERDEAESRKAEATAKQSEAEKEAQDLEQALKEAKAELNEQVLEKDQKIQLLEQEIGSLQEQLSELKQTYEKLEPILKLVQPQTDDDTPLKQEVEQPSNNGATPKVSERPQKTTRAPKTTSTTSTKRKSKTGDRPTSRQSAAKTTKTTTKTKQTAPKSSKKSPAPASKPTKQTSKSSSQADSNLDPSVVNALEAIMAYNDAPNRSFEEKWAISYPVMKELLTQVGASTQTKIKAVFDAKGKEIDQHMKKHKLGKRHNRNHQGESISDVLKLTAK